MSSAAGNSGKRQAMGTMHEYFDGSETDLIEAERKAFEADAGPYDFDLTRIKSAAPEPWSEYDDYATGHRWGGWLAASAYKSHEIGRLRAALKRIALNISGDTPAQVVAGDALRLNVKVTGAPPTDASKGDEA